MRNEIINHPEAQGREELAQKIAATDLPLADAIAMLQASPRREDAYVDGLWAGVIAAQNVAKGFS